MSSMASARETGLRNSGRRESLSANGRNAARGAWLGLFVDYFDIYLPIVVLTPAIIYFQPKTLSPTVATTFTYVLFAASFIGRPIGTFIFGHFGDVLGRKRTTVTAGLGVAVLTAITGLLPGYGTIGISALVLLALVRLVGGIFMGGQYTGANPLAMEQTPKRLRGLVGGTIAGAYPLAYVVISLITTFLLSKLGGADPGSAYVRWGWRIPFFIGALISLAFSLFYHRSVGESTLWEKQVAKKGRRVSPLRELFTGANRSAIIQVFVLMTGLWFGIQLLTAAAPTLLTKTLDQDSHSVTNGLLLVNLVVAVAYIAFGALGQRFGRRRMLALTGVWTATVTAAAFFFMVFNLKHGGSLPLSMVFAGICIVLSVAPNAMVVAYLCERFATTVRSSGYGVGYTLAVVIPSFYSFMLLGLGKIMPYEYSGIVLIVIGGLCTLIGALMGPDTNDVDLVAASAANPG